MIGEEGREVEKMIGGEGSGEDDRRARIGEERRRIG